LGDQAGQIIGDKVGGWVNDLRSADIVGTITTAWDGVVSGFKSAYDSIGKTWSGFVDSAKAGWDTIAGLFSSAYEGLKSIPVIGPAIQAVEDAAKKTAEAASAAAASAKAKAVEVGTKAAEGAKAGVEYLGNNTTIGKGVKAAGQGRRLSPRKQHLRQSEPTTSRPRRQAPRWKPSCPRDTVTRRCLTASREATA